MQGPENNFSGHLNFGFTFLIIYHHLCFCMLFVFLPKNQNTKSNFLVHSGCFSFAWSYESASCQITLRDAQTGDTIPVDKES